MAAKAHTLKEATKAVRDAMGIKTDSQLEKASADWAEMVEKQGTLERLPEQIDAMSGDKVIKIVRGLASIGASIGIEKKRFQALKRSVSEHGIAVPVSYSRLESTDGEYARFVIHAGWKRTCAAKEAGLDMMRDVIGKGTDLTGRSDAEIMAIGAQTNLHGQRSTRAQDATIYAVSRRYNVDGSERKEDEWATKAEVMASVSCGAKVAQLAIKVASMPIEQRRDVLIGRKTLYEATGNLSRANKKRKGIEVSETPGSTNGATKDAEPLVATGVDGQPRVITGAGILNPEASKQVIEATKANGETPEPPKNGARKPKAAPTGEAKKASDNAEIADYVEHNPEAAPLVDELCKAAERAEKAEAAMRIACEGSDALAAKAAEMERQIVDFQQQLRELAGHLVNASLVARIKRPKVDAICEGIIADVMGYDDPKDAEKGAGEGRE